MDYGYENYNSTLFGLAGGFTVLFIILGLILLAVLIVGIIALWKLYKKAGKQGWESIVPFYGYYVLTEIAGLNWWWFLLATADSIVSLFKVDKLSFIADLTSLFATFNIYYNIAKKFGKTTGTSVCAGIFNFIFILIFGFSRNEVYDANIPVSKNGIFGTPEVNYDNNGSSGATGTNNAQNMTNTVQENNNTSANKKGVNFCGNCGTKLNSDTKFCPNCGKENL